jgi:hypothetical protein
VKYQRPWATTTTSRITISLTPAGIVMSQETNPRPIHRLSCILTGTINNTITALRQTTPPLGGPETTSVIDNVSKIEHAPHPYVFFSTVFSGAGGKGECLNSPGSLICRYPIYMMTDKTGSNPDRVVANLKNRKQTN